ncbi:MAG TPA: serine hydrolase domain-containing protein [Tepidisphaeraceae bacterium]
MPNRSTVEPLEARSLFAITIPGTGIEIPDIDIPGIDIPGVDLPDGDDKSVSEVAAARRKQHGVPALAVATMKDGKLDDVAVVGTRKAGDPTRARWADRFLIGSATKAMTATLAARLVERGYMKWTSKVIDAFPGFAGKIKAQYANATLEQLLAHRSGLPQSLTTAQTIGSAIAPGTPMQIRNNYLRSILRLKPADPAGEYNYSDAGYIVAGALMETAMKEPYENLMRRLVFKPLGMDTAGFGWPGTEGTLDQPRAHDVLGKSYSPNAVNRFPAIFNPSGGVHVSVIDWSKFVGVQLGTMPKKFLTSDTVKKLRSPFAGGGTDYGLGWNIVEAGPIKVIQHDGTDGNWYASVTVVPDTDRAVLAVTNRGGLAGERAVHGVLADLQGRLY